VSLQFKPATKAKAKLRMALDGPAGAGKTYTALQVATALGGPIALIDTERGSASKYAGAFRFDTIELESFQPQLYMDAIKAAVAAEYPVLIIDSLSHAWAGKGGVLEQVDNLGGDGKGGKFFNGWKAMTPVHNALIDAVVSYPGHILFTLRTKTEYSTEGGSVKKLGLAPIQRDGVEYEADVVMDLDVRGTFVISKTRCPTVLRNGRYEDIPRVIQTLKAWLEEGTEPAPKPNANSKPSLFETLKRYVAAPAEEQKAILESLVPEDRAKILAKAKKVQDGEVALG